MASEVPWNPGIWAAAGGALPDGWDLVPFETFLESPRSMSVGVMYPGENVADGTPLIRVGDVGDGGVVGSPSMHISAEVHHEYRRTELQGNELLITLVGKPGVCVIARPHMKGWNVARALAAARLKDPEIRPYIKAVLESNTMKNIVLSMLNTTVQPTLNLKEIRSLPVPLPANRSIAIEIGSIAEDFNRRIALIGDTNHSLEKLASALFESWFVRFDPVRAKSEGREPEGMSADIAALFPSEFVDSEPGSIPKGWNLRTVGEIADVVKGKSYSSKDLVSGGSTALVTLKSFERGGGFRMDGFKPYTGPYKPAQVVRAGDVVLAFTDVTQAAELIGRPAIVVDVDEYETLVASLDVGIIRPALEGVSKEYIFGLLQSEAFLAHALAHTTGTTVLHLSKEAVPSFMAAIPPDPLIAAYSSIAAAIRSKVQSNIDMGRSLRSLRDLVLPALISGRIPPLPVIGMEAEVYGG